MKTLFIVNPTAGRNKCGLRWERFSQELSREAKFPFDVCVTTRKHEAESTAATVEGYKRLVAVGGDGTVNEVLNGMYRNPALQADRYCGDVDVAVNHTNLTSNPMAMGVLAFGTGNDLARTMGVPSTDREAIHFLNHPREIVMDVGQVNERYFVIAAGMGFDGIVARDINQHAELKKFGSLGYAWSALRVLGSFSPVELRIRVDGQDRVFARTWMVAVGNCPYYGGGMKICPNARSDDGWLDICVVANLSKPRFLTMFSSVYSGKHIHKKKYVTMMRGRDVEIHSPGNMVAHADGEITEDGRLTIRVAPMRLRFHTK